MTRWVAVLAAAALIQAPAAAGWSWPVDGPVLRPFVFGNDPYAGGQHRGIDIGAPPETPVHAASAGRVSFAGTVPSGGRTVTVQTMGGLSVTYLELGAIRVARGAEVAEGDPIGTVGPAGHVHLGVRVTADPHGYRDPLLFLPVRVDAPAQAGPVEVAQATGAQPDPVVEPSTAQAAAPEPDGPPPAATEPSGPPPAATEPAAARPDPVASDSATDEPAEPPPDRGGVKAGAPGKAGAEARALPTPVRVAEPVATRPARASATTAKPTARSRPAVARPKARPAPRPPARAKVNRSAGKPSTRGVASSVRARSKEVAAPALRVSGRRRMDTGTTVRQATLSEARAQHRAHGQPERPREEPGSARLEVVLGLMAVAVLGAVAAAGAAVRRRNQAVPQEGVSPEAAKSGKSPSCPVGRLRAPRVIHACARSGQPGWVVSLGTPRRRPTPLPRAGPLPRPRRRVLAGTPG
jgi:hypothetical protein